MPVITYPLDLPSEGKASITIRKRSVSDGTMSPYTGEEQIQVSAGQWWEAQIALPPLKSDASARWEAFFGKLNGREGYFLLGDPIRAVPRGIAKTNPGVPKVRLLHSARVNTVQLKGLPLNAFGYLLEGDHVQIGVGSDARLHQVLFDVDSNASGHGEITVWPSTRYDLAVDTPVTVQNARGCFRLAQPSSEIVRSRPVFSNVGFDAREVVP